MSDLTSFDHTSYLKLGSSVELKHFEWGEPLSVPPIEQVNSPSGRFYRTPGGDFPSVTRVLGAQEKPELEAWKQAVGEEEAARVARRAAAKGTALHAAMELYLSNQLTKDYVFPLQEVRDSFLAIKPAIDAGVTKVYAVEAALYSTKLRMAGTSDLVCDWNGERAILDYKNLGSIKYVEQITDYFIQETAYSCMVYEHTGHMHKKLVVATTAHGLPMVYEGEFTDLFVEKLFNLRDEYERKKS